ncbi:hypothetical protein B0H13DRAFT_1951719 [Mycena leptocephala]|nr:hypothetical protein B0H13DRAFT_1951719 [Mycena leptocephala]
MQRPVSSSDRGADECVVLVTCKSLQPLHWCRFNLQDFKAAQAEQVRKTNETPRPFTLNDLDGLREDCVRHSTRASPSHKHFTQATSAAQLLQLFARDNRETAEIRKTLHAALVQLDASTRRIAQSDAKRRALELSPLTQTVQTIQTASAAEQATAGAHAEISLYRLQIHHAQAEIAHAQGVVRALEGKRDDAERAARKARALARKLHEEKMAVLAREEGRKEGYETGFRHGKLITAARGQRRLQSEASQPSTPPVASEQGGEFFEEGRRRRNIPRRAPRDLSHSVPQYQAQQVQTQLQSQSRRCRESLNSARTIQQRPAAEDTPPPVQAAPSTPHPVFMDNNQPTPQAQNTESPRRHASTVSGSTAHGSRMNHRRGRTSIDGGSRASSRTGQASLTFAAAQNANGTFAATPQQISNRRNSTAGRASAGASNIAALGVDESLGLRSRSPPMLAAAMVSPLPQPVAQQPPARVVMQPVAMSPPPPDVRVERAGPRSSSSASTSLRVLPLTSFPAVWAGTSKVLEEPRERERDVTGAGGRAMVAGMTGAGDALCEIGGRGERERELSVISEAAHGESRLDMYGTGWDRDARPQRQQTPWGARAPSTDVSFLSMFPTTET